MSRTQIPRALTCNPDHIPFIAGNAILPPMNPIARFFGWTDPNDQQADVTPFALWNDIFLFAAGFFSLGVSLLGFFFELGPRFASGAELDILPIVSFALIGLIAVLLISEGVFRVNRTIRQLNEREK